MFITSATLTQAIADRLKLANGVGDLQQWTYSIIADALTASYQEILGRLLRRGFTLAQANSFDRGAEFQNDLGVYYFWTRTGIYGGNNVDAVKALDRRKELNSVIVFNAGVWVDPPQAAAGQAVVGRQDDGMFGWPHRWDCGEWGNDGEGCW